MDDSKTFSGFLKITKVWKIFSPAIAAVLLILYRRTVKRPFWRVVFLLAGIVGFALSLLFLLFFGRRIYYYLKTLPPITLEKDIELLKLNTDGDEKLILPKGTKLTLIFVPASESSIDSYNALDTYVDGVRYRLPFEYSQKFFS